MTSSDSLYICVKCFHQLSITCSNPSRHAKDRGASIVEAHWEKVRCIPSSSYSEHARQQAYRSDRGQYVGASLDKDRLLSQSIFLCYCLGLTQRSFASPTSRSTCSLLNSSLYVHSQLLCYLFSQKQCFPYPISFDPPPPCPKRLSPPPDPPSLLDTCFAIALALTFLFAAPPQIR